MVGILEWSNQSKGIQICILGCQQFLEGAKWQGEIWKSKEVEGIDLWASGCCNLPYDWGACL